jgi:hypothetical protein
MRFTDLLTKLIVEQSRFKVLYDKNVKPKDKDGRGGDKPKGHMDFETLKTLIFADPTTKKPDDFDIETATVDDMEKVKVGKYTNWLIKQYVNIELTPEEKEIDYRSPAFERVLLRARDLFMENLYKVTDDLNYFEVAKKYLPQDQRDINKFTISTLFDLLSDFKIPEKKKSEIEKKEVKKTRQGFNHKGGKILYEGPNWTLIKIDDKGQIGKDAAIWYGGFQAHRENESSWCTSAPGLSWFEKYIKDGPLYVVFPNDDKGQVGDKTGLPRERYQFHFPSNQYMDRDDRQIDLVGMLNGPMSELKDFFKPEFAKGLVSDGGEKVDIEYPGSSAGKFIALYGFDELFESLPDTIEYLYVKNESNTTIEYDLPETIGRFTNLTAIMFKNFIKKLPNSIGNLKNLSLVTLTNNAKLDTLPESMADLPELTFINLVGNSPNFKIPEKLKEQLTDEGDGFYLVQ